MQTTQRHVRSLHAPRVAPRVYLPPRYERPSGVGFGPVRLHRTYVPFFKIILGGFLVLVAVGGLLLMLPFASASGEFTAPADAFFTATSAVSATGLNTLDTADHWSTAGVVVIMTLIQIGGVGFMTMSAFLLLLVRDRVNTSDERVADSLGEVERGRFLWFVLGVLMVTLLIEGCGAYFFYTRFQSFSPERGILDSAFYAVSGFNNAGFDLEGGFAGIHGFRDDLALLGGLQALLVLGGLGVPLLIHLVSHRPWAGWSLDAKLSVCFSVLLLGFGALAIYGMESLASPTAGGSGGSASDPISAGFLASAARTAGFSTVSVGSLAAPTLLVLMFLMFIGGASGSTAGGIKVNTFATVAVTALSYLRGQERVHAFGKTIPEVQIHRAVAIVFLMASFIFAVTVVLTLTQGFGFLSVLFETVSAISTTGFTTGITPDLNLAGKVLVALAMFAGRLGPLTLVLALSVRTRPAREGARHDEPVHVG